MSSPTSDAPERRPGSSMRPESPAGAEQWFQLGLARLDLGLPEEAAKCFREVLALDSRHARAGVNLGMILQQTGRQEEAERCYRAAISADPGVAQGGFNPGASDLDRNRR